MKAKNPTGDGYIDVKFPEDAPMYETYCLDCGLVSGGGFLIDGWTFASAKADAERYAACPVCHYRRGQMTIRRVEGES